MSYYTVNIRFVCTCGGPLVPTKCFFLRLILQHFILVFTTCFSYFDFAPFYFRFYTFFLCLYNLLNCFCKIYLFNTPATCRHVMTAVWKYQSLLVFIHSLLVTCNEHRAEQISRTLNDIDLVMSDLRSFLTSRGVDNDVIDAMEQEKVIFLCAFVWLALRQKCRNWDNLHICFLIITCHNL